MDPAQNPYIKQQLGGGSVFIDCAGCGLAKPRGAFRARNDTRHGLRRRCRDCELAADRRRTDPDRRANRHGKTRVAFTAADREFFLLMDAKPCSACGVAKRFDQFKRAAIGFAGRQAECQECVAAERRERRRAAGYTPPDGTARADRQATARAARAVRARRRARLAWAFDNWQSGDDFLRGLAFAVFSAERTPRGDCFGPWSDPRLSKAEAYRVRYKMDPAYSLAERLRRQVTKQRKRDRFAEALRLAVKRNGSSPMCERAFGYTIAELRAHLARQFAPGMTWENMGDWHIDHIRPVSSFDLSDPAEFRACWSLPNLRPLWARENLTKGARRVVLI